MIAFSVAMVLSFVPAFVYAAILYWLDRFEREPLFMLFGAFAWGALIATTGAIILSIFFETGIIFLTGSIELAEFGGPTIIAPLVEESLKGLAVLLIFWLFRHEFDSVLDGIVYAGIVALGFAATENVLYLYFFGYEEDGWGGMIALFVLRVILGGWGHAVYSAFIGIGLAYARLTRNRLVQIGAPIVGWGIAVFLHALHNTMATVLIGVFGGFGLIVTLLVDWVSWAVVFGIILWEIRREQKWVAEYLAEEVQLGTITQDQYQHVCSLRDRVKGLFHGKAERHFYQLSVELAQKKHHYSIHGNRDNKLARIGAIRQELAGLATAG